MTCLTVQLAMLLVFLLTFHTNIGHAMNLPLAPQLEPKDIPIIGSIGNGPPPDFLITKNPSPECAAINQGGHLCCATTVNGGNILVQKLAGLVNYDLNPNAVNGIGCHRSTDGTCPKGKADLCCQVADLVTSLAALYCQCADDSLNPPAGILGVCRAT